MPCQSRPRRHPYSRRELPAETVEGEARREGRPADPKTSKNISALLMNAASAPATQPWPSPPGRTRHRALRPRETVLVLFRSAVDTWWGTGLPRRKRYSCLPPCSRSCRRQVTSCARTTGRSRFREGVVGCPLVASQTYRVHTQKNERLLTAVNGRVAVRGQQARKRKNHDD